MAMYVFESIERTLREKLAWSTCPVCGFTVCGPGVWRNKHIPYVSVEGNKIVAGYRCPKSLSPIIVMELPLQQPSPAPPQPNIPAVPTAPAPPQQTEVLQALAYLELPNGQRIPITLSSQEFGRNELASYLPPGQVSYLSRRHFRVFQQGGRWFVEDLGSTNGTLVDGRQIKGSGPVEIRDGSTISPAGVVMLRFVSSIAEGRSTEVMSEGARTTRGKAGRFL